jgi:hypothetical protein
VSSSAWSSIFAAVLRLLQLGLDVLVVVVDGSAVVGVVTSGGDGVLDEGQLLVGDGVVVPNGKGACSLMDTMQCPTTVMARR